MKKLKNKSLAVIVGAQKSGTTSMFNYLKEHTSVCASRIKQTFFFMPDDYYERNIFSVPKQFSTKIEDFLTLFPDGGEADKLFLESTPDYLHFDGARKRIKSYAQHFDKVKIIIILRHPVERFKSWHRFAMQQGRIKEGTSLKDFISMSRVLNSDYVDMDSCFFALESGAYEKFVGEYIKDFGGDVHVIDYFSLSEHPKKTMFSVCNAVGIDSEFYSSYRYPVSNKTIHVKSYWIRAVYMCFRKAYIQMIAFGLGKYIGGLRNVLSQVYHKYNETDLELSEDSEGERYLWDFYKKDIAYVNNAFQFNWEEQGRK